MLMFTDSLKTKIHTSGAREMVQQVKNSSYKQEGWKLDFSNPFRMSGYAYLPLLPALWGRQGTHKASRLITQVKTEISRFRKDPTSMFKMKGKTRKDKYKSWASEDGF